MATASFDKSFIVREKRAAAKLRANLRATHVVTVNKRDLEADKKKGLSLFKSLSSA